MKNRKVCLLLAGILTQSLYVASQLPGGPPDPPGVGHGASGDQLAGGSAPLHDGAWLLVVFLMLYATARLLHSLHKTHHLQTIKSRWHQQCERLPRKRWFPVAKTFTKKRIL